MSTRATRVVLADDEVLMREGLAGLLGRSSEMLGVTRRPARQAATKSRTVDT
jgi:DNA-binding NarL/FixJ family response regulator